MHNTHTLLTKTHMHVQYAHTTHTHTFTIANAYLLAYNTYIQIHIQAQPSTYSRTIHTNTKIYTFTCNTYIHEHKHLLIHV